MKKFYLLFLISVTFVINCAKANVSITAPALTVSGCPFPTGYSTLGNIVITEVNKGDFQSGTNLTLILSVPANFQFQAGVGTVTDNAQNVIINSYTVTSTTITVNLSVSGTNKTDIITISGIQVRGINGVTAASNITRTGGTATISGDANGTIHGTLTSTSPAVGTPTAITIASGSEPVCQLTNGTTTTTYATTATNSTGFNWSISNGSAGAINPSTGVMTWANGFSGSVNIQVTATGCIGTSSQVIRTVNITPTVGTPTSITVSSGTEPACQLTNATTTTTYATTATNSTGFNWSISNGSAGSINPSTGVMTWANGFYGTVDIRVTANGCNGASAQTVRTVSITPSAGTPTAITISSGTEPSCQLTNGTTTTTYGTTATNSSSFNWSLSNASAGSINTTTGVMTWANGFSGTVDIRVTANGCNGASAQTVRTVSITPSAGTPTAITISFGTEPACQLTNGTTTTTYTTTSSNSTGFNWSLSNAAAGSIDAVTGVMTWANGFAGTVDIQVTANGCNGLSAQVIRTVNIALPVGSPSPIIVSSGTEPTCQLTNGTTTTTYSTTAANSTGFNWSISNGAAGSINAATGVMTWANGFYGTVDIQATANGCYGPSSQVTRTVTVIQQAGIPTTITISSGTEPACQLTNGTTTTTYATTATNSSSFNWSLSNASAGVIDPTTGVMTWANGFSGTVDIRVTANGCNGASAQTVRTVSITPSAGTPTAITISSGTEPACQLTNGTTTTTYTTTSSNSTGFNWSLSNAAAGSIDAVTGVITWSNGFAGTVDIQVTANGCTGLSAQVIRTVNIALPVGSPSPIIVSSGTEPACQLTNGTTTTTYSTTAANSTGFNWSISNASAGSINTTTGVMTWANGFYGTVDIQVTANGCYGPSSQVIRTVNITAAASVPTAITILSGTEPSCQLTNGTTTTTYATTSANSTGFNWSLSNAAAGSIDAVTGVMTWANGFSGNVNIQVTANGCNGVTAQVLRLVTVTATVGTPTAITISSGTQPTCQLTNGTTTTTYATTATNTTGFNWSVSNASAGSINPATGVMTWANGFSGNVNIQVTANGCNGPSAQVIRTVSITSTVGVPAAITIGSGTEPTCQLTNGTTTTTYATTATNSTGFNWSISNAAAGSINASSGVMTWANGFSGTVDIRVTANGCNGPSSMVTRTVTVTPTVGTPVFAAGSSSVRCQGAGSVTYGASATNTTGITYTLDAGSLAAGNTINSASGNVTYTAGWSGTSTITASAAGCNGPKTSLHTVTITVIPAASISYAGTPFCRSIATAQPVTINGSGAYTGGTFASTAGLTINSSTGAITPSTSTAGTYTVTYTIPASGGCPSAQVTTSVTITAVPTATISYAGTPFCKSTSSAQPVTLNGTNAYTSGTYSSAAGLTINTSTGAIIPSTSTAGTYTVTYAIPTSGGCTVAPVTTSVTINAMPTVNAGTPVLTCASSGQAKDSFPVNITAGASAANYSSLVWTSSGTGTFANANSLTAATYTPSAADNTAGSVTLTLTAYGNAPCASVTSTKTLTITPAITGNFNWVPVAVCSGGGLMLTSAGTPTGGNGTFTYQWSVSYGNCGNPHFDLAGETGPDYILPAVAPPSAGDCFTRTIFSGGCKTESNKAKPNTFTTPPNTINFGASVTTICIGSSTTLTAQSAVSYTYSWSPATGLSTTTGATVIATPSVTTTYTVTGTATSGPACTKTGTVTVTVNPLATLSGVQSNTVCSGTNATITLNGLLSNSVSSITYTVGSGSPQTVSGVTSNGTGTGTFLLPVTSANNGQALTISSISSSIGGGPACTQNFSSNNSVILSVNPLPIAPTGTNGSSCGTGVVNISASTVPGSTIDWYATATGGAVLAGGSGTSNFTTPSLSVTTIYYAEARNITTGCISASRTAVTATINAIPSNPAGINASRCGTGSVAISANPAAGATIDWYAASSGGAVLPGGTGTTSFATPVISTTTIYYALARNTTTGCVSTSRVGVTATINAVPAIPAGINGSSCGAGAVVISATPGSGETIDWYGVSSSGSVLSGGAGTTTYITPGLSLTTTYYAESRNISSGCLSASRTAVSAIINSVPSVPLGINGSVCGSGSVIISATPGGGETIDWYSTSTAGTILSGGLGTTTFTTPVLSASTVYYAQARNITSGCISPGRIAVSATIQNIWTGLISNDWQNPNNWSGYALPTLSCPDVIIPSGTPYPAILSYGTGSVNNIIIQAGASLTVTNSILKIAGTISNSGVFTASNGTIELNGAAPQTIAGSMFNAKTLKNLTISNSIVSVSSTLNDTLKISGTLAFGNINNASFSTGDNVTLLSSSAVTARVADITNAGVNSGNTISGKAIVERYVPGHRAWRLMTVPFRASDTLSINSAWQEGAVDATLSDANPVNPSPGYGTHITGGPTRNAPNVGNTGNNGFDAGPNFASLYSYSSTAWSVLPANTHIPVKSQAAWMLFLRGNRSTDLRMATGAPTSPTILRPKGILKTGDTTINITATGFQPIGNPYASAINYYDIFHNAANASAKLSSYYYAWDPLVTGSNGVGAFITYFPDPNTAYKYIAIPDPTADHPIDMDGSIQSSQAFMVYDTASDVVIKETNKTTANDHYVFGRPAGNSSLVSELRTNLYAVNPDGSVSLSDGTLNLFNGSYTNTVNLLDDAKKMGQFAENLGLLRDGQLLSVEKRGLINAKDTIFYNIGRIKPKTYKLEFIAKNLYQPNLVAFLEDSYTATRIPVNLDGATVISITVDGSAASIVANRFRLVFETMGGPLPVTYSSIKAWQQNSNIAVEWKVENELNIKQYEIEKSTDGRSFTKVSSVTASGNNSITNEYNWLDTNTSEGNNFYRVISIDLNGEVKYSQVVKVAIGKGTAGISVYPNPVTDGVIGLQLNNMEGGNYGIKLMNSIGQVILTREINHNGGNATETIILSRYIAKGMYLMEVTHPDNRKTSIKVVSQ